MGNELNISKSSQEEKQRRLKEVEAFIDNLKNTNVSQEIALGKLRDQNDSLVKQIYNLEQQVAAYKERI